jgi:hypothetical protein
MGFPYVGILCYRFGCVLVRCILEGIVFMWLGSVGMFFCLEKEDIALLCILRKHDL